MKQVLKGTWVAEDILEERKQDFARAAKTAREKKKSERAAKKAARLAANPNRKKWFGLF